MCQYLLCQYLTELYAFLVEAIYIPQKALEHDLVLEMGEQRTHCFRSKLLADDDGARTVACKLLIVVVIILAACKCDDLCYYVCAQLLLAGAALDIYIYTQLALFEADELQRDDIGSLMQQLVEGMLTVGSRLTESTGPVG